MEPKRFANLIARWIAEPLGRTYVPKADGDRNSYGGRVQGPDTNPTTVAHIARTLQVGSNVDAEILNYDEAGRPFWAEMSITPEIKIDRKLERSQLADYLKLEALSTIISLARSVGAHVTAEGIETAAQAQMLTKLGAGTLQGYYFARPQPADMAPRLSHPSSYGAASASAQR